ncbi:hypothetical protein [Nonomuraea sp. NPDC049504]|uniref:hypothetical protein n=1 Tax=Nonomuraea sp. NPDC049504 TaxID=3154729 RepID=UPI0034170EDB
MSASLATELGVRRLLVAAGQAPSVLSTQPWRFRVARGERVEVFADPYAWAARPPWVTSLRLAKVA